MTRSTSAIVATLLALAAFGFAILSTGAQLRSDCSEAITGSYGAILFGLAIFAIGAVLAIRARGWSGYILVAGVVLIVLAFDWHQQLALADILRSNCPNVKVR